MKSLSKVKFLASAALALAAVFIANRLPLHAQAVGTAVPGSRPVAVLLCQYQGNTNTYGFTPAGILGTWLSNTLVWNGATVDNSINGLVTDASLGLVNLQGTQAFGWYMVPKPLSGYTVGSDVGTDCIAGAQAAGVNLTPFTYVMMYMNDALPDAAGESWHATLPGPAAPTALNASIVGVVGLNSPPLFLHELGHIFGSGVHTSSSTDPLGGGAGLGDDPSQGLIPGLTSFRVANVSPEWDASRREIFGFIPAASIATFTGGTQTYTISRLTKPIAGLPTAIDVPLPGGAKYVVSARTQIGYDAVSKLNGFLINALTVTEGVRIELVTDAPGSTVPAADVNLQMSNPGGDPTGTDAVWLGCQSFADNVNGIRITVGSFTAAGTQSTAQIIVASSATPGQAPAAPPIASCTPAPTPLTPVNTYPPFADTLAAAQTITVPVIYGQYLGNNGFTTDTNEPLSCNAPAGGGGALVGATGWLQFTPTTSGPLTASTQATMAAMLAVYSGPGTGATYASLVQVGCSSAPLVTTTISTAVPFTAVAGQAYYVQIGGLGGATGTFNLSIQ